MYLYVKCTIFFNKTQKIIPTLKKTNYLVFSFLIAEYKIVNYCNTVLCEESQECK